MCIYTGMQTHAHINTHARIHSHVLHKHTQSVSDHHGTTAGGPRVRACLHVSAEGSVKGGDGAVRAGTTAADVARWEKSRQLSVLQKLGARVVGWGCVTAVCMLSN